MSWEPPDQTSALTLRRIIERGKERALREFDAERRRIQNEQAAKGAVGGIVLIRCDQAADSIIREFARHVLTELVGVLGALGSGTPRLEAIDWAREAVVAQVEGLVVGIAGQIDGLKGTAGVQGAAGRLQVTRLEATRDVDIEVGKAKIGITTVSGQQLATPRITRRKVEAYNLLVSGDPSAWDGKPFVIESARFLEFTDPDLRQRLGKLDDAAIKELQSLQCVLAYEAVVDKAPLFGALHRIAPRPGEIRVEYEVIPVTPFVTADDLVELASQLDIKKFEAHRTHWSVKEVSLSRVLGSKGIVLPPRHRIRGSIDVAKHRFEVALSFPGEVRSFVERVADQLEGALGANAVFYDNYYRGQLARPALDVLLQNIYSLQSKLIVVFLCTDYERKEWCGLEFRAIKEKIMEKAHQKVMLIKMDDGNVEGIFKTDGYLDGRVHSTTDIAGMIEERVRLL